MIDQIGSIVKNTFDSIFNAGYSRLFIIDDNANWVLRCEAMELQKIAADLGINARLRHTFRGIFRQNIFFTSHFDLPRIAGFAAAGNRIGISYFHGKPTKDEPEFEINLGALSKYHGMISKVQVTHKEMKDIVLSTGIDESKVHLIPIGINLSYFTPATSESRRKARAKYSIPDSSTVIGYFQKDGNGWGEGLTPKLIKGPDIFLEAVKKLKSKHDNLFVLLSGPSRGYVKRGLAEAGIPFKHVFVADYSHIGQLYHAIDLYMVTSRQEGGPKAVLECMASDVPLITTRVGQAMELVKHKENGWMVDVEDIDGLAGWASYVIENYSSLGGVLKNARATAQENSYSRLVPLWGQFFDGMVL